MTASAKPIPVRPPAEKPSASEEFLPPSRSLPALRAASEHCVGCELFRRATQVVFGEGPADARMMLIGEQPGDQEDRSGRPFVGPAGALLDRALAKVGIERAQVYVTNAVKHFKWEPRGKRRLHQKPTAGEIQACRGWMMAELDAVRPDIIVCLGATAAQAFLGKKFSVTQRRGEVFETPWARFWMATYHPSALLRMPDADSRAAATAAFEEDLARAASLLAQVSVRRAS
jgi:uracil-DNA glycosylase family protein